MLFFPKQQQKIKILFFFLVLAFFSCTHSKSKLNEYGSALENVMLNDVSLFRGFNFGDSLNFIQSKEVNKAVEIGSDYLYYEYKLNSSGSFNIAYSFNEFGLNEIHSDIFINNTDETEEVFNNFKMYLDQHYGESQTQMGFNVWSVKSDEFGEVEINLSNESADFTIDNAPGKISLWFYPEKN